MSSELLGVETIRACARRGPDEATAARNWLIGLDLLPLDDKVIDEALDLEPPALRSLDALHLATALSIRDDVGVFIAYDHRLLTAARSSGLNVARPS